MLPDCTDPCKQRSTDCWWSRMFPVGSWCRGRSRCWSMFRESTLHQQPMLQCTKAKTNKPHGNEKTTTRMGFAGAGRATLTPARSNAKVGGTASLTTYWVVQWQSEGSQSTSQTMSSRRRTWGERSDRVPHDSDGAGASSSAMSASHVLYNQGTFLQGVKYKGNPLFFTKGTP